MKAKEGDGNQYYQTLVQSSSSIFRKRDGAGQLLSKGWACGLKQGCPSAFAGETCGSFFKEANRSVKSFTPYFGYTSLWNICDSDSKNVWNTPHLQQPPLNPFFPAMVAAVGCQSSLKRPSTNLIFSVWPPHPSDCDYSILATA
jgi:hypothetical protein